MAGKTTQQVEISSDLEFEKEVLQRLTAIEVKLDADYRALHGNGKKGILDRVADIENKIYSGGVLYRIIVGIIAWLTTTAIAIYGAIKN